MLLIIFPNFRLICPYFDNYNFWRCITHNIYHPHFWLVMTDLKERFYTWILKFVHITFCLLTKPCRSWRFWPYFIVKFLLSLCILFHLLIICVKFRLFDLFLNLEVFFQPGCFYKKKGLQKNNAQLITWSFLMTVKN